MSAKVFLLGFVTLFASASPGGSLPLVEGQPHHGATPLTISGSFAIAAVCRDGILVGADSRGTIKDRAGKMLAYYAGVQKVFQIGSTALAYTGQETIQNLYFWALVHHFARTATTSDLPALIPTFLRFTEATLPREAQIQVEGQALISAGYTGGEADACYYNRAQTVGPKSACGLKLVSSDVSIVDRRKAELPSMTCPAVEKLIREAIPRYAKENNLLDIGEPIYVLSISKSGSRWLGDAPAPTRWRYLHEFAASYWAGQIDMTLLPGATRHELDEVIRQGEAWSKGR